MNKFLIFISLGSILFFGCKSSKEISSPLLIKSDSRFLVLDSISAGKSILVDTTEGFFNIVTGMDMSIQMRKDFSKNVSRESILSDYKEFLKRDVENFSPNEKEYLSAVIQKIIPLCDRISKKFIPSKVQLIKTKGNHYGNGVFYTRENCIVIPENELALRDTASLSKVLIHELSHIYTRYNPRERKRLYALIGFKPLDRAVVVPAILRERVLSNPDGLNRQYGIELTQKDNSKIIGFPVIYCKTFHYEKTDGALFDLLAFDLFGLELQGDAYYLVTDNSGGSPLKLDRLNDFAKKIGPNTQYIIHPDEIIADNVMMSIYAQIDKGIWFQIPPQGKALLESVTDVLINPLPR
jgi:hypothetical protein